MKNTRRSFLAAGALMTSPILAAASASSPPILQVRSRTPIDLPTLPYAFTALEPHISAKTVELHFGTHHTGYVKRLIPMLDAAGLSGKSLEEVIALTHGKLDMIGIANNAGQAFNHQMYWSSLTPQSGSTPSAKLQAAIDRDFGSITKLKDALKAASDKHFGSGWAWLTATDDGKLSIIDTHDAGTPQAKGLHGLLVVDVWEHAYYLDRQAKRATYTAALVDNLLNWDFASANYAAI